MISRRRKTDEPILPAVDPLDLEFLSGLDVILLTDLRREDDLAFGGDRGLHAE